MFDHSLPKHSEYILVLCRADSASVSPQCPERVREIAGCLRPEAGFAETRIGIIGHSLGGKMAFYAGCVDSRVKAIVTSDWGIDWDRTNWSDPWYWGAARVAAMKAKGRTHADLLAYADGKPFMLIAGKYDDTASARAILDKVPSCRAHPERYVVLDHASGHRPPPDALEAGYRFLDRHLKNNPTDKEQK